MMRARNVLAALAVALLLVTFAPVPSRAAAPQTSWDALDSLDAVARNYVWLVLRIDQHIPGFNDYYYGPPEWKQRVEQEGKVPVEELRRELRELLVYVDGARGNPERLGWLRKQLVALDANLRKLQGEKLSIAEQAQLMFDLEVTPPTEKELDAALAELDRLLPGKGSLAERYAAWRDQFRVPASKLPEAYRMALEITRQRTHALLLLPANEKVELSFVQNKPWSAYNWFQGHAQSLIEINTDLPANALSIVDFAAHEAYPGHHTDLTTREQRLYHERGYIEWCVSPLYTPDNTMAEAVAQVGREVLMSEEEKLAWHRDVFFPALGIRNVDVELWAKLQKPLEKMARAGEGVPFMLFDQGKSEEEIVAFLQRYALANPDRARKTIQFDREWGAYTFTYTVGRGIVRRYLASGHARAKFVQLVTTPTYPSLIEDWIRRGVEP
jgi:hypothetical protein